MSRLPVALLIAALSLAAPPTSGVEGPPPETTDAPSPGAEEAVAPAHREEVVVRATFRDTVARDVPASVVVLDAEEVREAAVEHFEELSALAPNLHGSGEGNRTKYWQIRGIGEREQYEGAPDPSVGFVVDDVDLSGIGGVATLWDIDQVEILRGPQGTRYGASALAGMVYVRSAPPSPSFEADVELTVGTDAARAAGFAVGGPISGDGSASYRVAAQRHVQDGFRRNRALGRDDTHGRDETTVRGKLRLAPDPRWTVDLAGFWIDADDGYDAFAIDNGLDTWSDRPGRDAQRTVAGSARVTGAASDAFAVVAITSAADSEGTFGFDADWGSEGFWDPYTYDFVSTTERRRRTVSQEVRLLSAPGRGPVGWVAGVHAGRLDESNDTSDAGVYLDPAFPDEPFVLDARIRRDYRADTVAAFGEANFDLGARTDLGVGLRVERRATRYEDDAGNAFDPDETMVGGQVTVEHATSDAVRVYGRLARGYKGGGFNLGLPPEADDALRTYDAEYLWNLEAGVKGRAADGRFAGDVVGFWSVRRDQQVEISTQLDPGNPTTFVFFTDNAGKGRNAGVEASATWRATRALALRAALGFLDAEIVEFGSNPSLEGRDQAHAPRWTYAASATWRSAPGWFARLDVVGRSSFYYDDSHDRRSEPYTLVHARVGRELGAWTVEAWGRNLLDEVWTTRGFYFGNEPPDFPDRLYVKRGDPRQVGLTVRVRL